MFDQSPTLPKVREVQLDLFSSVFIWFHFLLLSVFGLNCWLLLLDFMLVLTSTLVNGKSIGPLTQHCFFRLFVCWVIRKFSDSFFKNTSSFGRKLNQNVDERCRKIICYAQYRASLYYYNFLYYSNVIQTIVVSFVLKQTIMRKIDSWVEQQKVCSLLKKVRGLILAERDCFASNALKLIIVPRYCGKSWQNKTTRKLVSLHSLLRGFCGKKLAKVHCDLAHILIYFIISNWTQ